MSNKWKYIFGATTITLIVGGVVYAIIKSKQAEKEEEQSISLSEAREIVANKKNKDSGWGDSYTPTTDEIEEYEDKIHFESNIEVVEETESRKIQAVKASDINEEDEDLDDEDDEYENINEHTPSPSIEPLKDFLYYEEGIDPKEDKELRYEPNSVEAKHQFIRMELADWEPNNDIYRIMIQLFEFAFVPTSDGDEILRTQIIDYKVQFFGFGSRWNKEVSFADVIFHYARTAEFNCGESVAYWVEYFLDFNEFEWDSTSHRIDTLILRLNSHTYFNEERQTFGLFGLTRESMDQAIRIANMNIDRSVTYEIEFNEFLKSCL